MVRARRRATTVVGRALLGMVVLGLVCLQLVLLGHGVAQAHARLEMSDPAAGSVLATAPTAVTLTFGEPVEVRDGALTVYDDRLERVDTGPVMAGDRPDQLRISLRAKLAHGTYVVSWHASSADTHPVTGTFQFSVGAPSPVRGAVPDGGHNDVAGAALGPLRWLGYAGLAAGAGVLVTVLWLWPSGLTAPRVRRLLVAGFVALAVSTVGGMLVQGVYASGQPFSALWSNPSSLDTHSHTFDTVYAVRIYLLLGLAGVAALAVARGHAASGRSRAGILTGAVAVTVAMVATWPVAGHSAAAPRVGLTLAANLAHTLAMALWLGGLTAVLAGTGLPDHRAAVARALPRFSTVALACVATLVVTGTYLAWTEVASVAALTPTTYGRVLVAKLVGVAALVVLGDLSRRWLRRSRPDPVGSAPAPGPDADAVSSRSLRSGLTGEVVVAALVLALTSALVAIIPARADYLEAWSTTVPARDGTVSVELLAPRAGDTVARVRLTPADGSARPVTTVSGSVSRPGSEPSALTPLPVAAADDGTIDVGLTFAGSGTWAVRLSLTGAGGASTTVSFVVPIAPDPS